MRLSPVLVLLLLGLPLPGEAQLAPDAPVSVAVPSDVLTDYQSVFGNQPSAVYDRPGNRRDVVEVALVQRALQLAGIDQVHLRPLDGYLRILQQLAEGKVALSGTSVWDHDARDMVEHLWLSQALVRRGEFVVGLYTRPGHPLLAESPTLSSLVRYTPVTSRHWKMDWSLLEQLGFQAIQYASSWESMSRMVLAGRADLVLAPFPQTADLRLPVEDGRYLVPVPGVKVAFPAERVIAVSKNYPDALLIYQALQAGLSQLRADGEVERAYRASGFFNPIVTHWTLLNP